MTVSSIRALVQDTPHMTLHQAETITNFVKQNGVRDILELGFRQGVSTTYLADALEELGAGHITTIDLVNARESEPGLHTFLAKTGLEHRVTAYYEPTSYIWRLMLMLEEDPTPRFDFCYLDGAHDWFVDGFAFFLVDRLLRPGGWIVFDDVDWTFNKSPSMRQSERVQAMPADERDTAQVRKVVELLVAPHPDYGPVRYQDEWAFAQKLKPSAPEPAPAADITTADAARLVLNRVAKRGRRVARRTWARVSPPAGR